MKIARMLSAALAILVSASAFAQFGSEEKKQVLAEIGHVMKQEAFVPGVDLGKWDTFIAKKESQIDGAESAGQFSYIVNSALREFGLSHIQLMRRGRRGGEETLSAVQGFRQMPSASGRVSGPATKVLPTSATGVPPQVSQTSANSDWAL